MRRAIGLKVVALYAVVVLTVASSIVEAQTPTPDLDVNNDGFVDAADLLLYVGGWHSGLRFTPTPTSTPVETTAPTPTRTPTSGQGGQEITINIPNLPVGAKSLVLVRIPAGSFQMGSNDPNWSESIEQPVHTVNIGYDYYLGKYEITQAQWQAIMGSNPASNYGVGDDYPVYYTSWYECQYFVTALNNLGQGTFRLPSEAEWEYACRAGTSTRFSLGNSSCLSTDCSSCDLAQYAWFCGNNSPNGTKEVGQLLPNAFGLYDMHGNVWEWCQDWIHDGYNGAPDDGSAWESPMTSTRVLRGGSWGGLPVNCRSALRSYGDPAVANNYFGFRVARAGSNLLPSVTPTPSNTAVPTPTLTPTSDHEHEITVNLPNLPTGAKPLVLVRIPAGSFQMGGSDPNWSDSIEQPVHTVNIGYDFYIGKYEITQAQWEVVMGSNPASNYGEGDDYPVYNISWNQSQYYITALNNLGHGTFRLPSEAEWEYACRAGTSTRFSFGNSSCSPAGCSTCDLAQYAWFCGNNSPDGTKAVGLLLPNAFGLYDMHGNVWEWCQDWIHDGYTGAPSDGSAWLSPITSTRVRRGGSWGGLPTNCRSAIRSYGDPAVGDIYFGLRLVLVPPTVLPIE